MYLGIDLGTSNSAVVGHLNGTTRLFKAADGSDVLPSVIYLDKRGHRFVGKSAQDRIMSAPANVAAGFKRLMGTKSPVRIGDQEWTPEDSSAEIIRTLVGQAVTESGEQHIDGSVITIPAAFNQMQSEATITAARKAGLERVSLLQEPVAAAMPPVPGTTYQGFVDAAGGGKDEFTLAIGHRHEGRIIVDLVTGRRGNPAAITAGYAETLKSYRIKTVRGDRYAGDWVSNEFKRHGIGYEPAGKSRSELYLDFLPALSAGTVELPPCDKLSKQFVGLERRTSRTGRDIIDHAPGANDDRANACAGLVALAIRKTVVPSIRSLGGEDWQPGRLSKTDKDMHGTSWIDGTIETHAKRITA